MGFETQDVERKVLTILKVLSDSQEVLGARVLARRLKDFDPNTNYEGLTHGNRLVSVTPYEVDTDSERRMLAQDLRWVVPYQTNAFVDKKYDSFEAYKADIIRVGSTAETVDRVLLSAEGELDE